MNKSKRDTATHKTARKVGGNEGTAVEGLQRPHGCKLVPNLHLSEYNITAELLQVYLVVMKLITARYIMLLQPGR